MIRRVLPVVAVLALAACSSAVTTASSTRPSAMALAQKIPGVTSCRDVAPDAGSTGAVACRLADGDPLKLVTFSARPAEMRWIQNGGTGSLPYPSNGACCIEGSLWAATVGLPDYVVHGSPPVIKALGGKVMPP